MTKDAKLSNQDASGRSPEEVDRLIARLERKLAKSEDHRIRLEHLSDTNQSFQREVLRQVQQAKDQIERQHEELQSEKARTDRLLRSIMPEAIAEELKQNGSVKPRRVEGATVMFADFVKFTKQTEKLDPLKLVQILDQYYSEFDRISASYGIEKVKTIGDAYMCVAGLNDENDNALRMTLAAQDMLKFVKTVKPVSFEKTHAQWAIRFGLNSGTLSAGVIGQDRLSFDIWGSTVNTAARVVEVCDVNSIFLSHTTADRIKKAIPLEHRGMVKAKGRGPIDVYKVAEIDVIDTV